MINRNINNILLFLLVSLHIIDCFTLYYKIIGYQIIQISNLFIIGILICLGHKNKFKIKEFVLLFLYSLTIFLLLCFGDFDKLGFITGHYFSVFLFFLLVCFSQDEIIKKYVTFFCAIVSIISMVSIVFYLLGTVIRLILPTGGYTSYKIDWADFDYISFYGLYFEGQKTLFFGKTITRNIGLFVEAPAFAYVLVLALFFELFWKKNISIIRIAILIATLFTTFSTTGISVALMLIFYNLYRKLIKKSVLKLLIPIGLLVCCFIVYIVVSDKLSIENDSGSARVDDIIACFKCFFDNPIFGSGYNSILELEVYRSAFRQGVSAGVSNGLPFVLANGGILFGMIYWLPTIFNTVRKLQNKIDENLWLFGFTNFILLFFTITEYTLLAETMLTISWITVIYPRRTYMIGSISKNSFLCIHRQTKIT